MSDMNINFYIGKKCYVMILRVKLILIYVFCPILNLIALYFFMQSLNYFCFKLKFVYENELVCLPSAKISLLHSHPHIHGNHFALS